MKKKQKQITKLFALMSMAASPVAAGTAFDPWVVSAEVVPMDHARASEAMAAILNIGFAAISRPRELAVSPRTTPSGAPACGNVASRAPRPVDCTPPSQVIMAETPTAPGPVVATPARAPARGGAR